MKNNNGITLVALIITIVVLLILAAVAISSIENGGIIEYARNSKTLYNEAQKNETGILGGYVNDLKYNTCTHTFVNDTCSKCGYKKTTTSECEHTFVNDVCSKCGFKNITTVECVHDWDANKGECTKCKEKCSHTSIESVSIQMSSGHTDEKKYHLTTKTCKLCKMVISKDKQENHTLNESYEYYNGTYHYKTIFCSLCKFEYEELEEHSLENDTEMLEKCVCGAHKYNWDPSYGECYGCYINQGLDSGKHIN